MGNIATWWNQRILGAYCGALGLAPAIEQAPIKTIITQNDDAEGQAMINAVPGTCTGFAQAFHPRVWIQAYGSSGPCLRTT